jgi:TetR/AcrR family transcriptional repressor of nem operon
MRYPAEETAARHQRILREASRLFRERGIGGVSLPEIMKAAELTHGPFYNHFESKEALIAQSLKCAMGICPASIAMTPETAVSRQLWPVK